MSSSSTAQRRPALSASWAVARVAPTTTPTLSRSALKPTCKRIYPSSPTTSNSVKFAALMQTVTLSTSTRTPGAHAFLKSPALLDPRRQVKLLWAKLSARALTWRWLTTTSLLPSRAWTTATTKRRPQHWLLLFPTSALLASFSKTSPRANSRLSSSSKTVFHPQESLPLSVPRTCARSVWLALPSLITHTSHLLFFQSVLGSTMRTLRHSCLT